MNNSVIICADDYGLNPGISQGIRQLIAADKIQATSCMVNAAGWAEEAAALLALDKPVQIGLHFNLTEGQSLHQVGGRTTCFRPLAPLIGRCYSRCLSSAWVQAEWQAQLGAFVDTIGRLPDFIDGHQHIHQLPVIRDVILAWYQQRPPGPKPWLRATTPALNLPAFRWKTRLLAWLGGRHWHDRLQAAQIPHNPCFAGVYDFSDRQDYPSLLNAWLTAAPPGTLLMCHPGLPDPAPDPIAAARQREWSALMGLRFS